MLDTAISNAKSLSPGRWFLSDGFSIARPRYRAAGSRRSASQTFDWNSKAA
jgi:hypothetical protein